MEGKGAGNKLMSLLWHQRKRATAFVLAFAMTFVNIANNVTIAFAAEEVQTEMSHNYAEAVFQLDTEDIKEAAQSAVNDGIKLDQDTISFSDLDGANAAAKYDRIFKAGKDVYEFFPSIGGEIPDGAELRTFIRTNGSGELNGEEEVLFLFINASSDMDFIFSVNINGVQTSGLKVAAHSAKLEEKAEKPSAGQGAGGGSGSSPSGNTAPEDTTVSPDNTEAAEEESSAEDTSGNLETPDAGDEEGGDIASDETDEVKVPDGDDGNLSDEAGDTGNSDENDSVNAPDENGNADVSDGDHNAEGTDEGGNADTSDEGSNSGSADEGSDAGTADEGNSGDISDEGGSSDSSGQEDSADTSDEGSDGEVSDEGGSADTFDEEKEDSAPGEATARISRHEVPVLTAANDMQDGELINDLEGQDSDARETEDSEDTYVEEDIDDTVIEVMGSLKGEALDSVILDDSYTARLYITTIGELPVEVETISTPSNAKNKAELVIHYVTPSEETGEDISIKEDKVVSKYTVGDSVDLDQYIAAVDGYLFSEFDTTAELSSSSILLDEYNEVTIRYESEQMMPMTMAMVWRLGADTVDVVYNFEGIEGGVEPETPDTIEVGRISDNAPAIEGFAFVNATVEGTPIVFIGKYNDIIYYSVDGDSAIELDHDEIVLNYKKLAQNYKVTFAYDTSKGYVEGEKTVEGEIGETLNYRFTVTPNKDCEVKAIMVNGNSYSAD